MLLRTLTALVGLCILLGALWAGVSWVFLLVSLAAVLGLREFYNLCPLPSAAAPQSARADRVKDATAGGAVAGSPPGAPGEPPRPRSLTLSPGDNPHWIIQGIIQETPHPAPGAPFEPGDAGALELARPTDYAVSIEPVEPGDAGAPGAAGPTDYGELHGEPAQSTPLPFSLGALWVVAFVIGGAAATGPLHFAGISLGIFIGGAFAALLWLIAFYRGENWPVAAAYLAGGPVYVGWLLAHVLLLVQLGDGQAADALSSGSLAQVVVDPGDDYALGRNWALFALLTTFATDTGAYLTGRAVGRHPLAPGISPNKTREGAIGGFAAAIAAALLLDQFFNLGLARESWNWQPPLIGATVGIVAQAGDLLESRLKRLSRIKDAGSLLPGHGGLLDRLDSLLLTIPAVYYLAIWAL